MSNTSKLFTTGDIYVPKRSGFDMSHESLFTTKVGTITPILVEEVVGNTDISIGVACNVQLPPMATDFFGRIDAHLEAFFCPYRICYGGYQDFISSITNFVSSFSGIEGLKTLDIITNNSIQGNSVNQFETPVNSSLPYITGVPSTSVVPGSLADMLGYKYDSGTRFSDIVTNILPFVAYHRIYESFYRPENLQKPAFIHPEQTNLIPINSIKYLPFRRFDAAGDARVVATTLNDGTDLFALRQRCWARDRFTTSRVMPLGGGFSAGYGGSDSGITITIGADDPSVEASLTIGTLRTANVLQEYLDRANIAGTKYRDAMYAKYGCRPPVLSDEPVFLGRAKFNCYNKGIYQTAPFDAGSTREGNPFNTIGAEYARTEAKGADSLVNSYHCLENGVVMVMFTLVPHAYYSTGTRRYLQSQYATDFGDALLQNIGDDVIYNCELDSGLNDQDLKGVFGYTPRYSHLLYHDDEVHGLFRDGESLQGYALQRSFDDGLPFSIDLNFVQIPTDYLDQVSVTSAEVSQFGCWVDAFFSEKIVTPLTNSVIPTLGKPDGMKRAKVSLNGSHL